MASFHALALPQDPLTFKNPIFPEPDEYLDSVPSATRKAIEAATEEYTDMHMGNVAGEEQYAEVSTAAMRRQVTRITLVPESM